VPAWILALVATALIPTARAETTLTVERKPDKTLFTHTFPADAVDGAVHLYSQGAWTWTAVLYLHSYDERLETCVDVQRLHPRKGRVEVGRPCVTLEGRETPTGQARVPAGKGAVTLVVTR
jgi:hypothetical protein